MSRATEAETSTNRLPDEFEPVAQETIERPYAFYRSLRGHAPVYRVPKVDALAVQDPPAHTRQRALTPPRL